MARTRSSDNYGRAASLAWAVWLDSEEGRMCTEGQATGQYLQNRLWRAYMRGWQDATKRRRYDRPERKGA